MTVLDSYQAKPGKVFRAYAMEDWTDGRCTLHAGSMLQGHVSQAERKTKTVKDGTLHLVVDSAECEKHHSVPVHLTLIALLGSEDDSPGGESHVGKAPNMSDQPLSIAGGLRSTETAAYNNRDALIGRRVPTNWTAGMVVDLPGTSLQVGGGAEGGTIVGTTNADARLPANTLLILQAGP